VVFHPDETQTITPVFRREKLSASFKATAPAVFEEAESTTVVLPNWSIRVDENGCLLLTKNS